MKITKFEELAERAVPWFIIAALVVILLTKCHPYPNKNVIKPDKTKATFR